MKPAILTAAIEVIASRGLNNWTVEAVSNHVPCAKGLINYHYRSKLELLTTAAEALRDERAADRLAAAKHAGTEALDQLWAALTGEVDSGRFAAWLSLAAADAPLRRAAATRPADATRLAVALSEALDLGGALLPEAQLIQASLDGLALRLLQGAQRKETEEAWHRFWLRTLP